MKSVSQALALAFAVAVLGTCAPLVASAEEPQTTKIKPSKEWAGRITNQQQKEAPKNGYIVSEKAWAKLWKDWTIAGDLPKVDFAKELILVSTNQSNSLGLVAILSDKGNLAIHQLDTAEAKPDCAYRIVLIKREGIKTIAGKPIEKE